MKSDGKFLLLSESCGKAEFLPLKMADKDAEQIVPEQNCIEIGVISGRGLVWNAQDVKKIRRNHRIVGCAVGCLPRCPNQNTCLGLPLQLMPEELSLLVEKGFVKISSTSHLMNPAPPKMKESLQKLHDDIYIEQVSHYKEKRKSTILSMADEIVEGKKKKMLENAEGKPKEKASKKRKGTSDESTSKISDEEAKMLLPDFNRDAIIENLLQRIKDVPKENCPVQLFTRCPWTPKDVDQPINWAYPSTEEEIMKFSIFKDLWEKGYYLTNGAKFGGDYLAYPGDPLRYHAFFVVVCVPYTKTLRAIDLIVLGRLGTQVKKTVILASLKPDGLIDYISHKWSGENV